MTERVPDTADPLSAPALRKAMRLQRGRLSASEQRAAADALCHHIVETELYQSCQHLAVYWAVNGEISVQPLIEDAWKQGKNCYLPLINEAQMVFVQYAENTAMAMNRFNIPEPVDQHNTIDAAALDVVITPLVAFDKSGNRLGMGGGFYDRTFSFINGNSNLGEDCFHTPSVAKPKLMGVGHACQQVDELQAESWDVPLHVIVTNEGLVS